jgi:hypothetical protein
MKPLSQGQEVIRVMYSHLIAAFQESTDLQAFPFGPLPDTGPEQTPVHRFV